MAKPATNAMDDAALRGFTEKIGYGNAHLVARKPGTKQCCYIGQVGGGWHYNGDQETDTAWVAGAAPWNWQMVKANYNVFALSNFNNGQIVKWVDPSTGQSIAFQPMALQWTNALNQIQQISMPQSVAAQANDDILYWPAAYGAGRNFRYQASPLRLNKQLIIDSPSSLPSTSYDTLELNFIISVSGGVNIMVNGAAWGKKSRKDTANSIAFQLPGGAVLWSFAVPRAWDSSGVPEGTTTGTMRLKKSGSSLYVSVRFPKAWIDAAVFPIILDPTVEYTVGASADDALPYSYNSQFLSNSNYNIWGTDATGYLYHCYCRWSGVTIPNGALIDVAYLSFYYNSIVGTPSGNKLYFQKSANPSAITTYAGFIGATKTTAYLNIGNGSSGWWNTDSIVSIIQELQAYDYSAGAAMHALVFASAVGANKRAVQDSQDAGHGPKLHIEYTEAAGGDPEGSLIGGKLLRGGLLLHGILGR